MVENTGLSPYRSAKGDSPIFAAKRQCFSCDADCAAKIGTVPCERLRYLLRFVKDDGRHCT